MHMKNLKEYIKECLFDDIDNIENTNGLDNATKGFEQLDKEKIIDWICEHYFRSIKNTWKPLPLTKSQIKIDLKTDPPIVNYKGSLGVKHDMPSLTNNGMFQWGVIKGDFKCEYCKSLKSLEYAPKEVEGNFNCNSCLLLESLEGAPKKVGGGFSCNYCKSLKSLKGAPKEVGWNFNCGNCTSLTSLKGAPEKVEGHFTCRVCQSLTSLEGAPKKVEGSFDCQYCTSLTSLEGAPKEISRNFICVNCGTKFTEDDIKKVSKVKEKIFC